LAWLCERVPGLVPVQVPGDGNCFYHSLVESPVVFFRAFKAKSKNPAFRIRQFVHRGVLPVASAGPAYASFQEDVVAKEGMSMSEWPETHIKTKVVPDDYVFRYICQLYCISLVILSVNYKGSLSLTQYLPVGGGVNVGTVRLVHERDMREGFIPDVRDPAEGPPDEDGIEELCEAIPELAKRSYEGHYQAHPIPFPEEVYELVGRNVVTVSQDVFLTASQADTYFQNASERKRAEQVLKVGTAATVAAAAKLKSQKPSPKAVRNAAKGAALKDEASDSKNPIVLSPENVSNAAEGAARKRGASDTKTGKKSRK